MTRIRTSPTVDAFVSCAGQRGTARLKMRAFAWLLVGLRAVIPVAWIAAAVLATVALPPLGAAGSAPLDDLVAAGRRRGRRSSSTPPSASASRCSPTRSWSSRDPGGLPPGTQERHAARRAGVRERRTPDLPEPARGPADQRRRRLAAAPAREPTPWSTTCSSTTRRTSTSAARSPTATREVPRRASGAVVGTTGAAPARLAQYEEIQDALPLVEAASVALILVIVGLAFRSLGAPLVTLFTAAIAYLITIRVLPWLGRALRRDRAGRGRADHRRAAARAGHGLLGVLPVGDAPAAAAGRAALDAVRAATAPDRADRAHRRAHRRRRHRRAGRRRARLLPRLRPGAGGHHADRARGLDHARARAAGAVRRAAVRRRPQGATGRTRGRSRTRTPTRRRSSARAEARIRRSRVADLAEPLAHFRLALTRPLHRGAPDAAAGGEAQTSTLAPAGRAHRLRPARRAADRDRLPRAARRARGGHGDTALGLGFVSALPPEQRGAAAANAAQRGLRARRPLPDRDRPRAARHRGPRGPARAPRGADRPRAGRRRGDRPARAAAAAPARRSSSPATAARPASPSSSTATRSAPPPSTAYEALRDRLPGPAASRAGSAPRARESAGETAVAGETVDARARRPQADRVVALAVNLLLLMLFLRALIAPLYLVAVSVLGLAASLGITTFVFQDLLGPRRPDLLRPVRRRGPAGRARLGLQRVRRRAHLGGGALDAPARGDRGRRRPRPPRRSPWPASRWPRASPCWRSCRCARSASSRS